MNSPLKILSALASHTIVGFALAMMIAAPVVAQPIQRVPIPNMTALSTPATDDLLIVYDLSAASVKKMNAGEMCVADGLAGGQIWNGGTADGDDLTIKANDTTDYPRLTLNDVAGSSTNDEACLMSDSVSTDGGKVCVGEQYVDIYPGDATDALRGTDGLGTDYWKLTQLGEVQATGNLTTDGGVQIGDSDATTNAACIDRDSSDRLFVDKDCDAARDAGEPLILDEYNPDQPPVSCAVCDEFTNNTEALTWEDGNMESATLSITKDGALFTGDSADDDFNVQWVDPPSSGNTDFTIHAEMYLDGDVAATTGNGCGLAVLYGGTVATPTALAMYYWVNAATDGFYLQTMTSYALGGAATVASRTASITDTAWAPSYLSLRYTDSSRALTSHLGVTQDYLPIDPSGTATLSADPIKIGYAVRRGGKCFFANFRARTDADRDNASD